MIRYDILWTGRLAAHRKQPAEKWQIKPSALMAVVTKTFFKVTTFNNAGDCVDIFYSIFDLFRSLAERKKEIRLPNAPTALVGDKAIHPGRCESCFRGRSDESR